MHMVPKGIKDVFKFVSKQLRTNFIVIILLIAIVVLMIVYQGVYTQVSIRANTCRTLLLGKDTFTIKKESFNGNNNYTKELELFKTLSPSEQEDYLASTKDEKIAKYGARLMQ